MKFNFDVFYLKRVTLLFWFVYFFLVLASNLTDGLAAMGVLPAEFALRSGNFGVVKSVVQVYRTPEWIAVILFLGAIAWEAWAAWLFWRAYRFLGRSASDRKQAIYQAYTVSIILWFTFIILDELFVAFQVADLEQKHLALLSTQFLTLLAVELLPERQGSA